MCGRFGRTSSGGYVLPALHALPPTQEIEDWPSTYNAAPGSASDRSGETDGSESTIQSVLWGSIPFWAKSPTSSKRLINAKAETAPQLPLFRQSFQRRRCLIPADWFYEWKVTTSGKTPYCIRMASHDPFFLAGLWDTWHYGQADAVQAFTILTTEPNEVTVKIHDRMPVIVRKEDYARWLDPSVREADKLLHILAPYPAEEMIAYPIRPLVNNVKNDGPELIEPMET